MKKYLLVSMAMLCAAAFVWADEAKEAEGLKATITGEATLEWGVDFGGSNSKDNGWHGAQHGFNNSAKIGVSVPIINKGSKSSKGDSLVSAEVNFEEIELKLNAGAEDNGKGGPVEGTFTPSVKKNDKGNWETDNKGLEGKVKGFSARLNIQDAYITIYDNPNFETKYANLWDKGFAGKAHEHYEFNPAFSAFGTKVGYANKNLMGLDVGLKFGSNGNWKNETTKNDKKQHGNQYAAGLDFKMAPNKYFAIDSQVNATFGWAGKFEDTKLSKSDAAFMAFGAKVESKPVDGLKLTLGFDGLTKTATGAITPDKYGQKKPVFGWDMGFDVEYRWISTGIYVASEGTPFASYQKNKDDNDTLTKRSADLGAYINFKTKDDLVKGLEAHAFLGVYNLLTDIKAVSKSMISAPVKDAEREAFYTYPLLLNLGVAYTYHINDSMWIKPHAEFWGETNHTVKAYDIDPVKKSYMGIAYNVGVDFSPAEKVTLMATWEHGGLTKKDDRKIGYQPAAGATPAGFGHILDENKLANHKVHNGTFKLGVKVQY
ncbi:MAG: major outer sheath protein Msp [Treponema sp.]